MLALPRDAFEAIREPSPSHPVTLLVLDHPLSLHLGRCKAVAATTRSAFPVEVSSTGAGECHVADGTVLGLVANDDLVAVTAGPVRDIALFRVR